MNKKAQSIIKKTKNLNVEAFEVGKENFESKSKYWDKIAKQRVDVCKNCNKLEEEPIDFLRVKDSVQYLSNKMCEACGCTASYLLRQSIKRCKLKKW